MELNAEERAILEGELSQEEQLLARAKRELAQHVAAHAELAVDAATTTGDLAAVALASRVRVAGKLLQAQTGSSTLFIAAFCVACDGFEFRILCCVLCYQSVALEFALDQSYFSHVSPQFLNGKRKAASRALHSSSVLALVVNEMFMPRIASILSYSISGKMICSLTPML